MGLQKSIKDIKILHDPSCFICEVHVLIVLQSEFGEFAMGLAIFWFHGS